MKTLILFRAILQGVGAQKTCFRKVLVLADAATRGDVSHWQFRILITIVSYESIRRVSYKYSWIQRNSRHHERERDLAELNDLSASQFLAKEHVLL